MCSPFSFCFVLFSSFKFTCKSCSCSLRCVWHSPWTPQHDVGMKVELPGSILNAPDVLKVPRLIQIIYEQEACQPWCATAWHLLRGSNKFIRKSCDSFFLLFVLNELFLCINRHVKFFSRFFFLEVNSSVPLTHPLMPLPQQEMIQQCWIQPKLCSEGDTSEGLGRFILVFFLLFLFISSSVAFFAPSEKTHH